MMVVIWYDENCGSKEVNNAMAAFDIHMNVLNGTMGMFYSKNGEVLMEC